MTDRPLEKVEPFVARWWATDNGRREWLSPSVAPDGYVVESAPAHVTRNDGHVRWGVWDRERKLDEGTSPDLPTAKCDALAKARELGLCCWFDGEAPMAFEGEWVDGWLVPVGTARRGLEGAAVARAVKSGLWALWGNIQTEGGQASDLVSARLAALESAARHGYRITIREAEAKPEPFTIEPWSYWTYDGGLTLVVTADEGVQGLNELMRWHPMDSGLHVGATRVPNPSHRHPDDPANIPAAVRKCIETHGADMVRRALESM